MPASSAIQTRKLPSPTVYVAEEKASEVMKLADVVTVVELGRIAWTRPREAVTEAELAAVYLSADLETEGDGNAARVGERRAVVATP